MFVRYAKEQRQDAGKGLRMGNDTFEWGFVFIAVVLLITLSLYVGYSVGVGTTSTCKADNIVMVKRCGKKVMYE